MRTPTVARLSAVIRGQKRVYQDHLGSAVQAASDLGCSLNELKDALPNGEFLKALQALGLGVRLSQELMALSRHSEKIVGLVEGYHKNELTSHLSAPALLKLCLDPDKQPRKKSKPVRADLRQFGDFEIEAELLRRSNRRRGNGTPSV